MADFLELEKKLGIQFKDRNLLREAFTHRSFLNEKEGKGLKHNERLEFLGDAVLELSVTKFLFDKFSSKAEGELTSLRAALVNTSMLFKIADELDLGKFLLLSRGEVKDIQKGRQHILANATEALIGAIYLDQGYEAADSFIRGRICANIEDILDKKLWRDPKSLFQEKAQEIVGITPVYDVLEETGPDHDKRFGVGVYLDGELVAEGEGASKQEAQMKAAENALEARGWGE